QQLDAAGQTGQDRDGGDQGQADDDGGLGGVAVGQAEGLAGDVGDLQAQEADGADGAGDHGQDAGDVGDGADPVGAYALAHQGPEQGARAQGQALFHTAHHDEGGQGAADGPGAEAPVGEGLGHGHGGAFHAAGGVGVLGWGVDVVGDGFGGGPEDPSGGQQGGQDHRVPAEPAEAWGDVPAHAYAP